MAESIITAALRIGDESRAATSRDATVEALLILAESDLPQAERFRMVAEWRELRLL